MRVLAVGSLLLILRLSALQATPLHPAFDLQGEGLTMTVAGVGRLNLQGNAEQQTEELRAAMTRLFPEAVALVREAREGFGA